MITPMGTRLEVIVFDVDGTLVDSERHGHRVAFNSAFAEMGLPYVWDEQTYGRWLSFHGGERRIDAFLEEAGHSAEERRELAPRLHAAKTRLLVEMIDTGRIPARPGIPELIDRLAGAGVRLAVASVGSAGWIGHLLGTLFPPNTFEVVVTGTDVDKRKPDPGCYLLVLDRMGVSPTAAVAIEDSAIGLTAALGAGMACVVVVNDYTAGEDMAGARLVLDGVGAGAKVLHDPDRVAPSLPLDRDILERLLDVGRPVPPPEIRTGLQT